jgi:hypothetical protein
MGRLSRAEKIFYLLSHAMDVGDEHRTLVFHNTILVKIERGQAWEALAELGRFIELCLQKGNRVEEARGHVMAGECRILMEDYRRALQDLIRARESMLKLGNGFDLALIHIYSARCHVELGDPDLALPLLRDASAFFTTQGYVTPLIPLMDLWMAAQAASDIKPLARDTFTFARNYRHCLPPRGRVVPAEAPRGDPLPSPSPS